jgi:hypothetical protein
MSLWFAANAFLLPPPSAVHSPLMHGQSGILDEVLLFGAPLVVTLLILMIASKRGRSRQERVRSRWTDAVNVEGVMEVDSDRTALSEAPQEHASQ